MKALAIVVALAVLLVGLAVQAQEGPIGHVIKADLKDGKGRAALKRGSHAPAGDRATVPITLQALKQRIFVYEGDQFTLSGGAIIWYFAGNQPKQAMNEAPLVYHPDRRGPETPRPSRPQQSPDDKDTKPPAGQPRFLFGEPRQRNLYVPTHGAMSLVWYTPPNCQLVSLRADGSGVHLSEQLSAGTVVKEAPLGVYRSEAWTEALAPLAERRNGADVTLTLTFVRKDKPNSEQKVTQEFHILPAAQGEGIYFAWRQWTNADPDDAFGKLADYWMTLEEQNCGMECTARLVDWWLEDKDNYAANAAMRALALRAECPYLEWVFKHRLPTEPNVK